MCGSMMTYYHVAAVIQHGSSRGSPTRLLINLRLVLAYRLFRDSMFPWVDHLKRGSIIQGFRADQYDSAISILQDHRHLIGLG